MESVEAFGYSALTIRDILNKSLIAGLNPVPDRVFNLKGSLLPAYLNLVGGGFLAITTVEDECLRYMEAYRFFAGITGAGPLVYFPDSTDVEDAGRQVEILLNANPRGEGPAHRTSFITTLATLMKPLKDSYALRSETLVLKKGMEVSRDDLVEILHDVFGYKRVALVMDKGEFSLRNYILDLYPPSSKNPVRVELFGDEIESLRTFSVETQRTVEPLEEFVLLPVRQSGGTKYLFELFGLDRIFLLNAAASGGEEFLKNLPSVPPRTILSEAPIDEGGIDAGALPLAGLGVLIEERSSIATLPGTIENLCRSNRAIIVSATTAQGERLRELFAENSMAVPVIDYAGLGTFDGNLCIATGVLNEGLYVPGLVVLTERELFGEVYKHRSGKKTTLTDMLRTMEDLKEGDYIVHEDHGIGIFAGLRKETTEGFESDMLIAEYADGARLYVPVYNIGSIKKYWSKEGALPVLDKLGGKTWAKKKARSRGKIKIIAGKLLRHYAERELVSGVSVSGDTEVHTEFDNFFPYEPTADQLSAIIDIKRDMESDKPMDRLLCGDVGYGKTEVAMRAAFKAVYDGLQVAVVVPTTILCEQHYLNFRERFSPFPIRIDYMSRFKPKGKINETVKQLAKGEIDIVIGTQGLLRKDMEIPALGLLVIDEEHRFGVAQKERIKELKKGVHCLSLSATPIPRTLQMSMSGIWTMSTIETPPEDRQAVRTVVAAFNRDILKEALQREILRGGQVFFVHNRIRDIEKMASVVKELAPHATIAVAHGQMNEKDLEDIMVRFIKQEIQILVSTSIIGSGIDIPSANTIIVNRADMMGLADLYQLRGRVGRSNVRAYAYLFIPGEDLITEDAKKRLTAIQELSYLGAGLRLAMKDMEIRGAGNLLGAEQSGHIDDLGFDSYMEMLEEEIAILRGLPTERAVQPAIELRVEALIPDDYVEDVTLRLNFYRRIALAKTEEELFGLEDEMSDRLGRLPEQAMALFNVMRLKLLCKELKIISLERALDRVSVVYAAEANPMPQHMQELNELQALQKAIGQKVRHLPSGFDVNVKGMEKTELLTMLIELLKTMRELKRTAQCAPALTLQ